MRRIGLVRDERFLAHQTGLHHVETPRRLSAISSMLEATGLGSTCRILAPRFAAIDELCLVHTERHIEKILDTAGEKLRYLDPDTVTSEQSCTAAFLAAGGCIAAVDEVMSGGPYDMLAAGTRAHAFCSASLQRVFKTENLKRKKICRIEVRHKNI